MLRYNEASRLSRAAERADAAHVGLLSLHALCCGAPLALAALSAAASLAGVGIGLGALTSWFGAAHSFVHGYEGWMLALSCVLVAVGAAAEAVRRRAGARRLPVLFLASTLCLAANAVIVLSHSHIAAAAVPG